MQEIDDILEGKEPPVEEQSQPETEQAQAPEETVEQEAAETEAKTAEAEDTGEKEASGPPSDVAEEVRGLLAATKAERERRQKAEQELEQYRKQLEEQKPPPSVFEDEQAAFQAWEQKFSSVLLNERLNTSEAYARDKFGNEKVDEALAAFQQMAQETPEVAHRVMQAPLPWVEMVGVVEKHNELEAMKDVDSYKAKLRAEVEAEVRKQLESELQKKAQIRESVPTSLVGEPSKGGLKGSDWSGPTPLDNLLGP